MSVAARWPLWPLDFGDPARLLWHDTRPFDAPWANAARVVASLPVDVRVTDSPAWQEPGAYLWTRIAHQLAAAVEHGTPVTGTAKRVLGASSPEEALARHLERFQEFALGAALAARADWRPPHPLHIRLPFAIPGTCLSLDGEGTAEIKGVREGRLDADVEARSCPVARHGGFELPLHPHAFRDAEFAEPAVRAGIPYHERHAELVERTLAAMAQYAPESFATFRRVIRRAALKPGDEGGYDDFSDAEMPGAFVASVVHHPLELADHFIHEMQHNRLQFIEESGPIFEGTAHEEPRYYSPWRDKLRGLYGIFHGVYVFVAVSRFWQEVHRGGLGGPYALDRVLRLPTQLALAVSVLERHAQLTPLGRAILGELSRNAAEVRRTSPSGDAPAFKVREDGSVVAEGRSVRETLLDHLRRNDVHGQCEGLLR
jgi:HEXXH motif-containing protein